MPRKRRLTAGFVRESQILARGASHVLDVLKARHPDREEARLAARCVLELEAWLNEAAGTVASHGLPGGESKGAQGDGPAGAR
jgi:hypothetical protein